jgi:hypothetical protein
MNRRELMIEYVNLRIQQKNETDPYYELLGDSLTLYDTIYKADSFICKLLDIDEFTDETLIGDFTYWITT